VCVRCSDRCRWFSGLTIPNSPTQRKVAFRSRGRSKRATAMTRKVIGAVYLTNIYLGPIDQAEANYSTVGKR
jgi:hypothetical protein